ncbi:MAG: flagellin [Deltaproteobacteria bacterium]|jgi:flagellin|nr:flagellin [Deltaproteobacteria bacterium]
MALIMNHNLPAITAAGFVTKAYGALSKSIERLSSGLRINSASDDAAGLAVRELLRADIAGGYQGIRNAADAVSLVQTADGALGVIDQKLIRMKELAMQSATGSYTGFQREIINSEYQAMAAEIDRIANATEFNGVRLLDGTLGGLNSGLGLKIHFGTGNSPVSDYYYVDVSDIRATSTTGLRIGGDGTNDIWSTGPYGDSTAGCCGGPFRDLSDVAVVDSGRAFGYGYNWDGEASGEGELFEPRYLAGRYGHRSGMTYAELVAAVNAGTQSRIGVAFNAAPYADAANGHYAALCLDTDEVYYIGSSARMPAGFLAGRDIAAAVPDGMRNAAGFAAAINGNQDSRYWAMVSGIPGPGAGGILYVFRKDGGDNNHLVAEEMVSSAGDKPFMSFVNVQTGQVTSSVGAFTLGGEDWGSMEAVRQRGGGYSIALLGRDIGDGMDLYITGGNTPADALLTSRLATAGIPAAGQNINLLARPYFTEIQDAADGPWIGAEIRTQEAAERALDAVDRAIESKDAIRANLGVIQTRLEATMEAQTLMVESLQAAESRISDADVAYEMTEFTKENILAQAATSMLAQANSLGSLALTLIRG